MTTIQWLVTILVSAGGLSFLQLVGRGIKMWRTGATMREQQLYAGTAKQRDEALEDLALMTEERNILQRQVGMAEHVILQQLGRDHLPDYGDDILPRRTVRQRAAEKKTPSRRRKGDDA